MKKPKVCMITTRHHPGDPRIFEKESRYLKSLGYDVDIVIPEGDMPANTYGIRFLTFRKAPRPFRKISTLIHTFNKSKLSGAQIYHCHEVDVSLFTGYLIKKFNRKSGIKLIFDCHEFFLSYFSDQIPKLFRWLFKIIFVAYEKMIVKTCDHIITANSIEKNYYQMLFPQKAVTVLYNVPHLNTGITNDSINHEKQFDLSFEGYLNYERGLKVLFELIKRLKNKFGDVRFLIVGYIQEGKYEEWANTFITENDLADNIVVTGWQPYNRIHSFHKQSKIGIFLYQYTTPNNILAGPPNKLFNFMKAGLPVVASDLPETSKILEETGCGIPVNPENIDEIEKAVLRLLTEQELRDEMGLKGKTAFRKKYNWEAEEKKLKLIYEKITAEDHALVPD